jgi:hypothetical protein
MGGGGWGVDGGRGEVGKGTEDKGGERLIRSSSDNGMRGSRGGSRGEGEGAKGSCFGRK